MSLDAMKQALEALETVFMPHHPAVINLRHAIEQAEKQEPVAWMHWLHGPVRLFMNKDEAMMELARLNREYPVDDNARQMRPLYTAPLQQEKQEPVAYCDIHHLQEPCMQCAKEHEGYNTPPQRQPLTQEEIWREYQGLWPFHPAEEPKLAADIVALTRAVERKHGIGA